jgi:hypothetical protein
MISSDVEPLPGIFGEIEQDRWRVLGARLPVAIGAAVVEVGLVLALANGSELTVPVVEDLVTQTGTSATNRPRDRRRR